MLLAKRHRGAPRVSALTPMRPSRDWSNGSGAGRGRRRPSTFYQEGFTAEHLHLERRELEADSTAMSMSAEQLYQKTLDDFSVVDGQEGKVFRRIRARPTFV
jgi:hypothetical protein